MQVNNNVQSPNFGMALKIKCSQKDLEAAGAKTLEKLAKAGEELADTRYWDVEVLPTALIGELKYRIKGNHCANAYIFGVKGKEVPHNEFLTIQSSWGGTNDVCGKRKGDPCETVMRLANKDAAVAAYESLKRTSGIDNAVAATKILEDWTRLRDTQLALENANNKKVAVKAADLIKKYGSVEI